jgi:hypothetical protein
MIWLDYCNNQYKKNKKLLKKWQNLIIRCVYKLLIWKEMECRLIVVNCIILIKNLKLAISDKKICKNYREKYNNYKKKMIK